MQRPKVAARAAAAADLLGRQPLGELAAARLEALGAPRRHTQQARGVAVDKVRVRVRVRARALGLGLGLRLGLGQKLGVGVGAGVGVGVGLGSG